MLEASRETLDDISVLSIVGGSDYFCMMRATVDSTPELPSPTSPGENTRNSTTDDPSNAAPAPDGDSDCESDDDKANSLHQVHKQEIQNNK